MDFSKIVSDLLEYHRTTISKPKNKRKYEYNGYDTTSSSIRATSPSVKQWFSKEEIEFREENGMKPIEILITCAVQLGIQQGINMCSEKPILYLESEEQKQLNENLFKKLFK